MIFEIDKSAVDGCSFDKGFGSMQTVRHVRRRANLFTVIVSVNVAPTLPPYQRV